MEYIGKRVLISRIDIAPMLQTILFSLCLKMIEKLEKSRVYKKKRRFNRFDARDASGNLLGSTVYGKSRADVEARETSI